MKIKDGWITTLNEITLCPNCDSCVECCQKGIVCVEDGIAQDFHLTRAEFLLIKYGNSTAGEINPTH